MGLLLWRLRGDEIMRKNYELKGNGIVETKQYPLGYSIKELYEIPPNRFDPFEALDIIMSFVQTDTQLDKVFADTVRNQVHALRAYITGMKQ